jgi:hypothetical protein
MNGTKKELKKTIEITSIIKYLVKWLRWPENKITGRVPWFVVLWRLPWFLLIYIGISIAWVGVVCCYGINKAAQFWRDAT